MNSSSPSLETKPVETAAATVITLEAFAPYVGEKFDLVLGADRCEPLELASATAYARPAPAGFRAPFELIFRASTRNFYVPQGTYAFQHPAAGRHEIFVVPIGPDDAGMQFQAIYN